MGGVAHGKRHFVPALFWIIRTGAPWGELPPDFGGWSYTPRRFIRWRGQGVWEKLLELLFDEPDGEQLMIVDAYGMPLSALVTQGTVADCKQVIAQIDGFSAHYLLADRDYDKDEIIKQAWLQGMSVVLSSRKKRKTQRDDDRALEKAHHPVENIFLYWKQ